MSKATPGIPYTIVKGDTLSEIAKQAYGDGRRWREIWLANDTVLKSGVPNLIFPGEIIKIPSDLVEQAAIAELSAAEPGAAVFPTIPNKALDDFTIIVDDVEIPVISGRALRTADTAADGWSAVVAVNLDDVDLVRALTPYTYPEGVCYLGGELILQGVLYGTEPSLVEKMRTNILEGWSPTVDVIDSTGKAPYEAKNITLEQRARNLVEPLGIQVVFDVDADEPFKRVTMEPTEKIFDHLAKLATQRGILITSTELGALKFTRAGSGKPVATIEEGSVLGQNFSAKFDGRKRFNIYKALSQSPARKRASKNKSKSQVAKDDTVPKSRTMTFTADDTTAGGMQAAADWKRSKQLADALTMPFNVPSWYDPNGNLWKENTIVTVKSATIYVSNGFDFLIRSVEYTFDEKGTRAVLNLVPPQVFTGEQLDEPWAADSIRTRNLVDRVVGAL